jgi:outer membrane lipase/esterase
MSTMRGLGGAFAAAMAVLGPASAATLDYSDLYVFGDSLSDVGRAFALSGGEIPLTPPYFQGQFTGPGGPVWAEIVGDRFEAEGKPVRNYAIGGTEALGTDFSSRPPPLAAQLAEFTFDRITGSVTPGPKPLAAFWVGANDIFGALSGGTGETVARLAASAVTTAAASLAPLGVEDFIFLTLGDLSLAPRFAGTALAPAAKAASEAYDARLRRGARLLPFFGLDGEIIDAGGLLESAVADPAAFGFTNVTDPCVVPSGAVVLPNCTTTDTLLWWDPVHPNSRAHEAIAGVVLDEIGGVAHVPLPATLPLAIGALGVLWGVSRRRGRLESR